MERLTRAVADARARRVAGGLSARGIGAGDRIAVILPVPGDHRDDGQRRRAAAEQSAVIALVWGALRLGVIPVMVNPALTPRERDVILADAAVALVVDSPDTARLVEDAAPVDIADIPLGRPMHYTSGTTGRSKGVWSGVLDEETARTLWHEEADLWGIDEGDVLLGHGPLAHSAPLRFALATLLRGGTVVLPGWFDAPAMAQALVDHRPTLAFAVPTHLQRLLDLPGGPPPSPYRLLAHAGSACAPALKRRIHAWAGVECTVEFYGSTEGQFSVCTGPEWEERPGTVGRARTGRRLRVDKGVIWCSAPAWAEFEYWRNPEATAAAWRTGPHGREFTVGDLGRLDDAGYLWLDGRRDDLVITGGVNVYPDEVEAALLECPGVEQVAVFGIDDERWGQRVCAAVVGDVRRESLEAWARERLAPFKRPKEYHRVGGLPLTETGKVRRLALPEVLGLGGEQS